MPQFPLCQTSNRSYKMISGLGYEAQDFFTQPIEVQAYGLS
jgi:hypothetical protein